MFRATSPETYRWSTLRGLSLVLFADLYAATFGGAMKLTVENSWNYLNYYWGDMKLEASDITHVKIKWPNGQLDKRSRTVHIDTSNIWGRDHGSQYVVAQFRPYVVVKYKGSAVRVYLHKVDLAEVLLRSGTKLND